MKAYSFDILKSEATYKLPSSKIISALSSDKSYMDHFYLKGYEGLCLALNHRELTESVISSVVPMGRELLVVGDAEACNLWRNVCHSLSIRVSVIDASDADLQTAIETILGVNVRISHIMCATTCGDDLLRNIGAMARKHRKSFVVDNTNDALTLEDMENAGVDFAIAGGDNADNASVIVARRSKLVMTEGNARSNTHDIYAVWQGSLSGRTSTWAPMA